MGSTRNHSLLIANLTREITQQLKGKSCELYPSGMCVAAACLYAYPDIVVVCDEPIFESDDLRTLLNPVLIIEVLSQESTLYDRGEKCKCYCTIESLAEYVLVEQDHYRVEQLTKQSDGGWLCSSETDVENTLELKSIQCVITLKEIYDRVSFQ